MTKPLIVGALVLAAVAAGVVYLMDDSADQPAAQAPSSSDKGTTAEPTPPAPRRSGISQREPGSAASGSDTRPVPSDPRLAVLQVSPDNGLIKFVVDASGRVIAEIDQDPASLGFGKPTREYLYAGDQVVELTAYRYMSDHVEIARTMVAYKPDGSVDEIRESTRYDRGPQKNSR